MNIYRTLNSGEQAYLDLLSVIQHAEAFELTLVSITKDNGNFIIALNSPFPPDQLAHLFIEEVV